MGDELDVVRDVSARLEQAGIAYMLTGSMAMNYYAQPRMTRDIDMVTAIGIADGERIARIFEPEYYVSQEAALEAIDSHSELQIRDVRNLITTGCDRAYVDHWTSHLGVDALWQEIIR